MKPVKVVAKSPGNLAFFGDMVVVWDRHAIGSAVDKRTEVTVKQRKDNQIIIQSAVYGPTIGLISDAHVVSCQTSNEMDPLLKLSDYLVKTFKISNGYEASIESQVPVQSGMSSSSAVLSAMLGAISELNGFSIKPEDYINHLRQFQAIYHGGRASGYEVLASSIGGTNIFKKNGDSGQYEHLDIKGKLDVVIGNTNILSPTWKTVGRYLPALMEKRTKQTTEYFDKVDRITLEGRRALEDYDLERVGELMYENHTILKKLKLSHPKLEECIQEAMKAGALGAKLSGAGRGGVMFALAREEDQDKIANAIKKTGASVMKTYVNAKGIEIYKE